MSRFSSLAKSWKLRSISKRLAIDADRPLSLADIRHDSPYIKQQEAAERDLFDLIEADSSLKRVLAGHRASRAHLAKAYELLEAGGCGHWVAGHWVAASALAFPATLDFVLRHTIASPESININVISRVIQYFEHGESGALT